MPLVYRHTDYHGVATISRLLKITGLFCKRALEKRLYSAKETYNFNEPTNRSHPIAQLRTSSRHKVNFDNYSNQKHNTTRVLRKSAGVTSPVATISRLIKIIGLFCRI